MADLLGAHVAPKGISKIVSVCLATVYNIRVAKNISKSIERIPGSDWK